MAKLNDIRCILDLMGSVESHILQTYQNTLSMSDGLQTCEENSPHQPPFAINYLEYDDCHEPVTSWIIRHIFAYSYYGHHPYFESFAMTFLQRIGFKMEWINSPIIYKDYEYKGIDILIRDKQYAVIIENKLKGACFQLNQLSRYIATMRSEGYSDDQIFVVVLPKNNITNDNLSNSVWRLPTDWQSSNLTRRCRVNDYSCWCDGDYKREEEHCMKCELLKDVFEKRTLFIHKELSDWLYCCMTNNTVCLPEEEVNKQYVLKSAALQFVDFLNFLYNNRENDLYKMDIQKFLSEQLMLNNYNLEEQLTKVEDKINDAGELAQKLRDLHLCKVKSYIDKIREKYHVHIISREKDLRYDYETTLGGIPLTLSVVFVCDKEKNYCQLETNSDNILEFIMKYNNIVDELNDGNNRKNLIWRYDTRNESLYRFERILGKLLEIKGNS